MNLTNETYVIKISGKSSTEFYYKDEDGWFLLINNPCRHLQPGGRCGIYETRPQICREHSNDGCEFEGPSGEEDDLHFVPRPLHFDPVNSRTLILAPLRMPLEYAPCVWACRDVLSRKAKVSSNSSGRIIGSNPVHLRP